MYMLIIKILNRQILTIFEYLMNLIFKILKQIFILLLYKQKILTNEIADLLGLQHYM